MLEVLAENMGYMEGPDRMDRKKCSMD